MPIHAYVQKNKLKFSVDVTFISKPRPLNKQKIDCLKLTTGYL